MEAIVDPLRPGDSGATVGNLQDALTELARRGAFAVPSDRLDALLRALENERERQTYGNATRELVAQLQTQQTSPSNGAVDKPTADALNHLLQSFGLIRALAAGRVVHGTITREGDRSLSGLTVVAFDRDLRTRQKLGAGNVDPQGGYSIPYSAGSTVRAERGSADVYVEVRDRDDNVIGKSETTFNAPPDHRIDLTLPNDSPRRSELELLLADVTPLLAGQGSGGADLSIGELTDDDVSFVVSETARSRELVSALVSASKLTKEAGELAKEGEVTSQRWELFLAVCYGISRERGPHTLLGIVRLDDASLSEVLEAAMNSGTIRRILPEELTQVLALLQQVRVSLAAAAAKPGDPPTIGDSIRTLPRTLQVSDGLLTTVVGALLLADSSGKPPADRLLGAGLNRQQTFGVLRAARLRDLTGGYLPLVRSLQVDDPDDSAGRLEDLASWSQAQWVQRVTEVGVPGRLGYAADHSGIVAYAETLRRRIELLHPTQYIAARIRDGRIPVDETARNEVLAFLSNNPTFRMGETGVLAHFLQPTEFRLNGTSADSVRTIQRALLRIERAVKITPTLELAESLLRAGFDSGRKVVSRSPAAFVSEVASIVPGGPDVAAGIWESAHTVTAAVTALVINHSPRFNTGKVSLVSGDAQQSGLATSHLPPTLRTLFGSTDYCECSGCTSLTSAAAYFVDLLHMLGTGAKNGNGKTPLDVLLERRRDLAEVDLTCENTDTLIPYIDVALEVLERPLSHSALGVRVARGAREPDGNIADYGFDAELDKGDLAVVPVALLDDLASWGIVLSRNSRVSKTADSVDPTGATIRRWVLRDGGWKVYLSGFGGIPRRACARPGGCLRRSQNSPFPMDTSIRCCPQGD